MIIEAFRESQGYHVENSHYCHFNLYTLRPASKSLGIEPVVPMPLPGLTRESPIFAIFVCPPPSSRKHRSAHHVLQSDGSLYPGDDTKDVLQSGSCEVMS